MNYRARQATRHLAALAIAVPFLLSTGCLAIDMKEQAKINESEQIPVTFANTKAAHDFYAGLHHSDREPYTDAETFLIPFLIAKRTELYHQTAHYNAEVRLADINGDSEVTEAEALAYLSYKSSVDPRSDG